jgi:hypothetical protein
MSRPASVALDVFIVALLAILVGAIGYHAQDFLGFPKGYDGIGHVATINLLLENWPHFLWNNAWYGGQPFFPGSYAPLYTIVEALGVKVSGASIAQVMDASLAAMMVMSVASMYGLVRVLGRTRLIAIAASVLLVSAPIVWRASLINGNYPRLAAWGLANVATFVAATYCCKPTRFRFAAAAVILSLALGCHPATGVVGAIQVLAVLIAVPRWTYEVRLRRMASFTVVVAGLAAWFYLPYLLPAHSYYLPIPQTLASSIPAPFSLLISNGGVPLAGFPALLVPSALIIAGIALWVTRRPPSTRGLPPQAVKRDAWWARRQHLARPLAAAAALVITALVSLAYAFVGHVSSIKLIWGINPPDQLMYAVWPLAAAVGIVLAAVVELISRRGLRTVIGACSLVIAAVSLASVVPAYLHPGNRLNTGGTKAHEVAAALPDTNGTRDYRIAGASDAVTEAINAFTPTPQNRGYEAQGTLNVDLQTRMEEILDNPDSPPPEIRFMADWYSIAWMYEGSGLTTAQQDNLRAAGFVPKTKATSRTRNGSPYMVYDAVGPRPILRATTSPTTLVIGESLNYQYLLDALSMAGDTSAERIPVQGTPFIDDYTIQQLEQFPSLFLYGFSAHDPGAAARLLDAYERHGGLVVVEVAGDVPLAEEIATAVPGVLPVSSWGTAETAGNWKFTADPSSPITAHTDFGKFSAALYGQSAPWLTQFARYPIRGTTVLLRSIGEPVVVEHRDGAGSALMSGINLPYHTAIFSNPIEAHFLVGFFGRPRTHSDVPALKGPALANADAASITVPAGGSGVMLDEQDFHNWHATINGVAAAIWPAGPGMMYVPLDGRSPATVVFSYGLSGLERLGIATTAGTLVLLVAFLFGAPWAFMRRLAERLVAWHRGRSGATLAVESVPGPLRRRP